jgi:hypothetical protein
MDPSAMYVVYRHREKHIDRRPEAEKGVSTLPAEHEKLKTKQMTAFWDILPCSL